MSLYTTGEIAKMCGVTVRTVQYYDTRGILIPSQLSEGGRRLYTEDDVHRMKIICFLREMDMSIDSIAQLLTEEHPEEIISIIIEQQEKELRSEIDALQEKENKLYYLKEGLRAVSDFSLESIGDIALQMQNKKQRRRFIASTLVTAIPLTILEWVGIILIFTKGMWWPFIAYVAVAVPYGFWEFKRFYKAAWYICPACHKVFKPTKKEVLWAKHTLTTRKLTCTCCGHHGLCVETFGNGEMQ